METFSRETLDPPETNSLEPWFVTGLIEGAGSFTFSHSDRNIALYFAIGRDVDDAPLLLRIQDHFGGAGKLYTTTSARPRQYLRIAKLVELLRVVDHFERYPLQGEKAQGFYVWREMVFLKQRFRKPDRNALEQLAQRLSGLLHQGRA